MNKRNYIRRELIKKEFFTTKSVAGITGSPVKTKRRLHDRKTEHFRALTSNSHSSAIDDHMTQTGHRIKWVHFDILATGQSDIHCKIKETLLIRDLKPALNENVGSEKRLLC